MTAIDYQHDILAAMVRKLMDPSSFVGKPEVRRDRAHPHPRQVGGRKPLTVERSEQRLLPLPEQTKEKDAG